MTKTKSTELAIVDEKRLAELRQQDISNEAKITQWPARIKVNRNLLDDAGNPLPMGKYVFKYNDVDHFFEAMEFIVMAKGTQFMWFKGKGEYVGCTMIEDSFNPEYKDSIGGHRLGREAGLTKDQMTTAQQEVKFHFRVLGVANLANAVDREGNRIYEDSAAQWVPASLDFTGLKSVTKQNELKKLKKKGKAYFDFITILAKPYEDGKLAGVPFYNFTLEKGDDTVLTGELLDSVEAAKQLVENENRRIYNLHLEAQSGDNVEGEGYTDLDLPQDDD